MKHILGAMAVKTVLVGLLACIALPAYGSPIAYNFSATVSGGPLSGTVLPGTLTVDSAVVASGYGAVTITSFNLLGTALTGAAAAFGGMPAAAFGPTGDLTGIFSYVVLSNARANALGATADGQILPASISSFAFESVFNYGTDPALGETFKGGAVAGSVQTITPVPSPASLPLLLTSLAIAGMIGAAQRFRFTLRKPALPCDRRP